jgi:hypothetical protein
MLKGLLTITIVSVLLGVPSSLMAQGRSGKDTAPGQAAEKQMERAAEAAEKAKAKKAEAEERWDSQEGKIEEEKEGLAGGKAKGRPEHAASATPGFFERARRFFGFGRSQERMSDQAKEVEQATQQERGPQIDED